MVCRTSSRAARYVSHSRRPQVRTPTKESLPPAPATARGISRRRRRPILDQCGTRRQRMRLRSTSMSKPSMLWPTSTSGSLACTACSSCPSSSCSLAHTRTLSALLRSSALGSARRMMLALPLLSGRIRVMCWDGVLRCVGPSAATASWRSREATTTSCACVRGWTTVLREKDMVRSGGDASGPWSIFTSDPAPATLTSNAHHDRAVGCSCGSRMRSQHGPMRSRPSRKFSRHGAWVPKTREKVRPVSRGSSGRAVGERTTLR